MGLRNCKKRERRRCEIHRPGLCRRARQFRQLVVRTQSELAPIQLDPRVGQILCVQSVALCWCGKINRLRHGAVQIDREERDATLYTAQTLGVEVQT